MNTVSNAWHSPILSRQVCDLARDVTGSGRVIEHAIMITHSMGNLILANAIATGECRLGKSSRWVSSQGPLAGSVSADGLQNYCRGLTPLSSADNFAQVLDFTTSTMLGVLGRCPPSAADASLAIEYGNYSTGQLNERYRAAQRVYRDNVDAAICGVNSFGVPSIYSIALTVISALSGHTSANDGLVEFESCRAGLKHPFGSHYLNRFNRADINHADGTFRTEDGSWGYSRHPLKWFNHLFRKKRQLPLPRHQREIILPYSADNYL